MNSVVNLHRAGATAIVELNRPGALNALDVEHSSRLLEALGEVATDDDVRAVVLAGAGRAFCSGADLVEMNDLKAETVGGRPDLRRALNERFNPVTLLLREMPKPIIAAINGPCVGIGAGYALACDHVVAGESAYFLLAFVNIGLAPDGGASAFIPARVGVTRATELAMSGRRLPAAEALAWGLIDEVTADADLRSRAETIADGFSKGATRAYAAIKRQTNAMLYPRLREQLALEADIQQDLVGSKDFIEGVNAFRERRTAVFAGT